MHLRSLDVFVSESAATTAGAFFFGILNVESVDFAEAMSPDLISALGGSALAWCGSTIRGPLGFSLNFLGLDRFRNGVRFTTRLLLKAEYLPCLV